MFQKLSDHFKNYLNLSAPISSLYFIVLYVVVSVAVTPFVLLFISQEQMELLLLGEITRLDFLGRSFFLFYEILLLPLYFRRLLDVGLDKLWRDVIVMLIFVPVVLSTFLSAGGYDVMNSALGMFRFFALVLTMLMFIAPTGQFKGDKS